MRALINDSIPPTKLPLTILLIPTQRRPLVVKNNYKYLSENILQKMKIFETIGRKLKEKQFKMIKSKLPRHKIYL